jgi:hypothetical protein
MDAGHQVRRVTQTKNYKPGTWNSELETKIASHTFTLIASGNYKMQDIMVYGKGKRDVAVGIATLLRLCPV